MGGQRWKLTRLPTPTIHDVTPVTCHLIWPSGSSSRAAITRTVGTLLDIAGKLHGMLQEPGRTPVSRYIITAKCPSPLHRPRILSTSFAGLGSVQDSASDALQLVRRQHVDSGAAKVDSLFHHLYQNAVGGPHVRDAGQRGFYLKGI